MTKYTSDGFEVPDWMEIQEGTSEGQMSLAEANRYLNLQPEPQKAFYKKIKARNHLKILKEKKMRGIESKGDLNARTRP